MHDNDRPLEFPEDGQLQLYFDHFVKYHGKRRWNRRLTYDGGCPQVNRRDTGQPVPLFPGLAVSRTRAHLEGRLWLSLYPGKMVDHNVIDYDGKMVCGYVREGRDLRPICCPDVHWFLGLKKLMGAFSGRMVCISSATLGVHLWRRLLLSTTWYMHDKVSRQLAATGVKPEVFPDPSKPFRRPFGRDYRTITPQGILTDWRDQLDYYLDDERQLPDFPTVVRAFIEVIDAEVGRARDAITTFDQRGRQGRIDFLTIAERLTIVEGWLRAGCPDWEEPREEDTNCPDWQEPEEDREVGEQQLTDQDPWFSYSVPLSPGDQSPQLLSEPSTDQDPWFSYSVVLSPTDQSPHLRSGEWAKGLEYLAIHGLQEPDSVGMVLYEMATFLYWVELFDVPDGEREQEIIALLTTFVRSKHNGMVDRLNNGREHEVIRQVHQAVRAVARNRHPGCLEHFARIRQRRDEHRYSHVINLAPLIEAGEQAQGSHIPWFYYSVVLSRDDSPAPEPVEATLAKVARFNKMRRRNGEYPFVRFARRVLNVLWANQGHARINREDLLTLTDSGDPNQLVEYRRLLVEASILESYRGTYRAGTAASLYRMTQATRRAYEALYESLSRPSAG